MKLFKINAQHAIHIDCIDEVHVFDYGNYHAVRVNYTIQGQHFSDFLFKSPHKERAEKYLANLIKRLNRR